MVISRWRDTMSIQHDEHFTFIACHDGKRVTLRHAIRDRLDFIIWLINALGYRIESMRLERK